MKKILISLLVVVTFLTLTSCGNKNVSEDSSVEIQDKNSKNLIWNYDGEN